MFSPVATSSILDKGAKGNYKKKKHTSIFPMDYRKATGSESVKISHGIIEYSKNN